MIILNFGISFVFLMCNILDYIKSNYVIYSATNVVPNVMVMSHVLGYVMGSWKFLNLNIYSATNVLLCECLTFWSCHMSWAMSQGLGEFKISKTPQKIQNFSWF